MRAACRILGLALFVGASLWWWATGANRGWTKTQVPVTTLDEITGITGIRYEQRLVPGVDVLIPSALIAAALFGGSFFRRQAPAR